MIWAAAPGQVVSARIIDLKILALMMVITRSASVTYLLTLSLQSTD
jgi:hypothetical protein